MLWLTDDADSATLLHRWTRVMDTYPGCAIYAKHFTDVKGKRVSAQIRKDHGEFTRAVSVFDADKRVAYFTMDYRKISYRRIEKQLRVLGYEPIAR